MAKYTADSVLDAALDKVATATALHLVDAAPADRAATLAASLGTVALGGTAFTKADGDNGGRKVTVGAQSVPITADGNVNHAVLIDGAEILHYTSMATTRAVLDGDTASVAAWDITIGDPT